MGNFYTDFICKSPRFHTRERISSLDLLEPVTRRKVEAILQDAAANGIPLLVYETYRSCERQEDLFHQGATRLRQVGVHHYGLACDIVKRVKDQPSWDGSFAFLGHLARCHGLIWGGDWGLPGQAHSFVDPDHVQRVTLAQQPELFQGSWYPDSGVLSAKEAK